jgi:FkbM family methyltransferase
VLGLVRPIVRPVLRRWRKFLLAPMLGAVRRSEAANAKLARRIEAIARTQATLREAIARADAATRQTLERMEALNRQAIARADAHSREAATRTERANQAMATVVADAMLTAAIGAARHAVPHIDPADYSAESVTSLTLPHGLEARVTFANADESVGGPIASSGGLWEPHIQRFFERNVAADCCFLDVGANIGVHSLNVASLAPDGQVIAFEAHPRTFEFLARNLGARSGFARMQAVHAALWDRPARLQIAGAAELVGSSFLVPNQSEASAAEQKLRAANPSALRDRQMHVAAFEIDAVTLDSWMEVNRPPRVDLIKIDVEGAEARVVDGARELIARYRPTLVIEYNPSCAIGYFGDAPDRLFHLLQELFATIGLIEADGELTPLTNWDELARRIAAGKGWEDLACGS